MIPLNAAIVEHSFQLKDVIKRTIYREEFALFTQIGLQCVCTLGGNSAEKASIFLL